MFKHKKLASNKFSKKGIHTLKSKNAKASASPVKTNFHLRDAFNQKFIE